MAGRFIPDSIHVCVEHEVYFDAPEHHGCTECRLNAVVEAAREALHEYDSHGGKGTHTECLVGLCALSADMDRLQCALAALDAAREGKG